jgi:hypothetical protein
VLIKAGFTPQDLDLVHDLEAIQGPDVSGRDYRFGALALGQRGMMFEGLPSSAMNFPTL